MNRWKGDARKPVEVEFSHFQIACLLPLFLNPMFLTFLGPLGSGLVAEEAQVLCPCIDYEEWQSR